MEHAPTWLTYGLMYLSAAVLAVPLAKALGLQLQAHQKQHQHHAKLGKFQRGLHVFHQPQPPGANGNARRQVANDGAQAQRPRQRHQEHCSRQVHKTGGQPSGCVGHGEMPKILPSGRGG